MKIYIHIGGSKCGSSAIQNFLRHNSEVLKTREFYIPSKEFDDSADFTGNHVWYFQSIADQTVEDTSRFKRSFSTYIADKPDNSSIIVSAENLSNPIHHEKQFAFLKNDHDLKIIFYIRRQDDYFQSAWQQWYAKSSNDLYEWVIKNVGILSNWRTVIEDWEAVVGRDNMNIRLFERQFLKDQDVIFDFMELTGIEKDDRLNVNFPNVNPSYNEAVSEIARLSTSLFSGPHDNNFYNMISRLTEDRHLKRSEHHLFPGNIRQAIMERYREDNRWIKEAYFPDLPRPNLFRDVQRDGKERPSDKELAEMKEDLMLDLIHQLYNLRS